MKKSILRTATAVCITAIISCNSNPQSANPPKSDSDSVMTAAATTAPPAGPAFDTAQYDRLLQHMANGDTTGRWPVKTAYPKAGAILPFNRIIAYYGNLYSTRMGALGEFPKKEMLRRLQAEVDKWTKADSLTPAIPALHYIAITAQNDPGKAGKYRLRMPFSQIDTVVNWAKEINGLVFIDIQVGLSTLQEEMPEFEKYLAMPNVHLGIDPEFSMKTGKKPGSVIGTYDAADINYVIKYISDIAKKNNLPPKVLVIHRFTKAMVTNYKKIKLDPYVQVVMDMDGWGNAPKKIGTYKAFIYPEPVQFTGFKLFYKNDAKRVNQPREMQPEQVLKLTPQPVYIQYQ